MSLTVGEHNEILRRQDITMVKIGECLPKIANTLRYSEIRNLNKELYEIGAISKEEYIDTLKQLAEDLLYI